MSKVEITDTCWLWTAAKSKGYGSFFLNGFMRPAHRLSLETTLGRPIAGGLVAAHSPGICHNRACVNPDHLREATESENQLDRSLDGTDNRGARNGVAKLTEAEVMAIRTDIRPQSKIATEYGINQALVCRIKQRKAWAHVV